MVAHAQSNKVIPLFKVFMSDEAVKAASETLKSGYITQGPKVELFEDRLQEFLGIRPLTVNSCTSALQLAVYLAGATNGDLIISTPMTCSATNTAIKAMGGQIIWADIDPRTGNIDPTSVNKLLERYPKVKAVMAVHWAGYPCDIDALNDMGKHYDVKIIEDAAHAFGAVYRNNRIGNHSDFVCFSFQAIKHLTTVDGGALVCKDPEDYKRGKLLRWFGIDRDAPKIDNRIEQDIEEAGWKYHMNDVDASIGIENLKHLPSIIATHQHNGSYLDNHLLGIKHILPYYRHTDRLSAHWIYTLRTQKRSSLKAYLEERGIASSQVHSRLDKHTTFQDALGAEYLPGVEEFANTQLSIPCGWWVTQEDLEYIVETIKEWSKNV